MQKRVVGFTSRPGVFTPYRKALFARAMSAAGTSAGQLVALGRLFAAVGLPDQAAQLTGKATLLWQPPAKA